MESYWANKKRYSLPVRPWKVEEKPDGSEALLFNAVETSPFSAPCQEAFEYMFRKSLAQMAFMVDYWNVYHEYNQTDVYLHNNYADLISFGLEVLEHPKDPGMVGQFGVETANMVCDVGQINILMLPTDFDAIEHPRLAHLAQEYKEINERASAAPKIRYREVRQPTCEEIVEIWGEMLVKNSNIRHMICPGNGMPPYAHVFLHLDGSSLHDASDLLDTILRKSLWAINFIYNHLDLCAQGNFNLLPDFRIAVNVHNAQSPAEHFQIGLKILNDDLSEHLKQEAGKILEKIFKVDVRIFPRAHHVHADIE